MTKIDKFLTELDFCLIQYDIKAFERFMDFHKDFYSYKFRRKWKAKTQKEKEIDLIKMVLERKETLEKTTTYQKALKDIKKGKINNE